MGITGLIPFLEKASSKIHLSSIKGSTLAIDTYCWLHKGAFGCAEKLARGEPTDFYVQYCLKYVNLLLSFNIKPILVFDGRHLPAKELTEKRRRDSRKECKRKAKDLLREGKVDEASSFLKRSVDVTHEMALKVIQECRKRNVDCIVAPYEADAQMAYLNKINIADYIITEDSDLVLFGATKTIFKLDLAGNGLLVDSSKIHIAMGCSENKYTFDKFRIMCILSGCDYLDSLPGIGLAKACKFVLLTAETDMTKALIKLPSYLNLKNVTVTKDYIDNFLKAEATFKHMFVYDPFKRSVVRLNNLPDIPGIEDACSNAGVNDLDSDTALNLALGNINPFTLKILDNFHPDSYNLKPPNKFEKITIAKHSSIWTNNFKKHEIIKNKDKTCAFQFNVVKKKKSGEKDELILEDLKQDNDSDIMTMYAQPSEYEDDDFESNEPETEEISIDKKRNPFGKKVSSRSTLMKASTSLIKSLSPKKKIDEVGKQPIREVRSRFFLPFVKSEKVVKVDENQNSTNNTKQGAGLIKEEEETNCTKPMKRKGSFETDNSPKRSLKEDAKDDEDSSNSNIMDNNESEENEISDPTICDNRSSLTSSLEEDDDDDVIIISEEKVEPKKSFNFLSNLKKIPSKSKIRPVGLPKPKNKEKVEQPKNQSSLSMFGFQKKQSV